MEYGLTIEGVTKRFGAQTAVDNLSLRVGELRSVEATALFRTAMGKSVVPGDPEAFFSVGLRGATRHSSARSLDTSRV